MPSSKKGVLVVSSGGAAKELAAKIQKDEPVLLLYHAHWCPHCVEYAPAWKQVCTYIQTEFGGKVCCSEVESEHIPLLPAGMPQVRGFPTLMLIQGTRMEEFGGDRKDKAAIKAFLQKNVKSRRPATAGGAAATKAKAVKTVKATKAVKK